MLVAKSKPCNKVLHVSSFTLYCPPFSGRPPSLAHFESFTLECFLALANPPRRAHALRCSGVVFRARAFPPRFPKAIAWGSCPTRSIFYITLSKFTSTKKGLVVVVWSSKTGNRIRRAWAGYFEPIVDTAAREWSNLTRVGLWLNWERTERNGSLRTVSAHLSARGCYLETSVKEKNPDELSELDIVWTDYRKEWEKPTGGGEVR